MNRRGYLAALASAGVVGTGLAIHRWNSDPVGVDSVTIETLDAPGSDAGTIQIPLLDQPTVVDCFATWCSTCRAMMPRLGQVHEQYDDVEFVSVSVEPIGLSVHRHDIVEWWKQHDGRWTVGIDQNLEFTGSFDITTVPTTLVFDDTQRVVARETGMKSVETMSTWLSGT